MFVELILGLIAFLLVWDYISKKHRNDVFIKSGIRGPKTLPILGNSLDIKHVNTENMIDFVQQCKEKYGKIYRLWVLHQVSVFVLDVKYLEVIFGSQQMIKKSQLYDFIAGWLGRGLLLSWGKKWHSRRKIITPTFHFKILEQFVEIFDQQSSVMVEKLYAKADGKTEIDIFPVVCLCALDIITETAMGVKVNAQEKPGLEYVQAIAKMSQISANRVFSPLQRTDFLFRLSAPKLFKQTEHCIATLHKFTIDVIEQRRMALEQSLKDGSFKKASDDSDLNTKKRMALLDVLLQSTVNGAPLTNEDIREEVDTFMFEGHDTTTSGIAFALYLIARHPEVQAKLVEEIKHVLGTDKSKPVGFRDLQDLKYMECVIKETLRLYPSVPVIGREITEDILVGDITIPANTNININLFAVMRDPDYFPEPNAFKPERFSDDSMQKVNPFAYAPFSAGPRNCIGQKFATLEMKSTISKMLRHFELLPLGPDAKPIINLIIRSSTGVHIGSNESILLKLFLCEKLKDFAPKKRENIIVFKCYQSPSLTLVYFGFKNNMFLELILGLIGLLFVWDYLNKKHRYEILDKSGIPGPKPLPIVGNAVHNRHVNSDNLIEFARENKIKYGKIYRFWMLHQVSVMVLDPKYLEIILSSQQMIKKSSLYDFFVEIFDQQSSIMVRKLYEKADGKTDIDIFPVVCLSALDIIAETAMGVKVNAQEQPGLEYVQAIANLSRIMADRFVKPSQRTDFLFRLTAPKQYEEAKRCIKVLHKFTTDVIEQRRLALEQSIKDGTFKNESEDSDLNTKKRMALLDVLLQSTINGAPLSNEDIREEVDTFMFEGHDTTTSGISFTLYLIARHPEVQAKLVEEIKQVLGTDKNKPVTYRDLQDLKYMELVIKESQRLYPSVPAIGREITEDIKVGDITIPANTNVNIPLFMVLRDPDYFTNPNDFIPERFESDSNQKIHPFAYTPFSAGPRNCIGQKFAIFEIKSTVSKMLRHFELLPLGPDVRPVINLILRSKTGMHIGLKPRDLKNVKENTHNMFWELLIGSLTFLLVLDYFNKKHREELFKKAGIKGPKPLPLVGNVLLALGNSTTHVFEFLRVLSENYGKVVRLWVFGDCVILLRDVKYFESILSSQQVIKKDSLYDLLKCWLGDGLLISSGSKWHARRKIITPTYHFKILEQFVEVFDQQSCIMVNRLKDKADGKTPLNMFPIVCLTALDIIAETAMGVKINAQENPNFPYAKSVTDVADIIATRFMKPAQRFEFLFRLLEYRSYRKMKQSIEIMHNFTDKVIRERREALEKSIKDGTFVAMTNATDEMGVKKRMAFLDVLLQSTVAGKPLTNEDIREEVDTFMFEGHDTTTSGISHTLYLLARHPEVQQKVFEEILQVIGNDKEDHKPVTMRELQDLKYLDVVIKESLRLYPPVPMIGRFTEQDVELDGKIIPANVNISLLIYAACRDPDYFTKPNDFIPERFMTNTLDQVNPFAYVPFSAGPRNCIGQKFAVLEMKSTISKMIRHFELLPLGEEVVPVMNLILRSATGINMGLKPRILYEKVNLKSELENCYQQHAVLPLLTQFTLKSQVDLGIVYLKKKNNNLFKTTVLKLFGFVLFLCILIWDYLSKRRRYRIFSESRIPGPSYTLPIIGDVIVTIGNDTLNVFALFQRLGAQFGKVFRIWLFHRVLVIVKDPKYFEVILSSQHLIKKPFIYDMLSCWLGDGLLLSYGRKWHARRKILTPTYHFKILENFVEVYDRQSKVLVKKLQTKADGKTTFDIFPVICLTALDIIAETAMGVKINAQDNPHFPYASAVKEATNILATRTVRPLLYYDITFLVTEFRLYLKLRKSIKIMHDFTNKVINERRATMIHEKQTKEVPIRDLAEGQKKRLAFLDVLLEATIDGKPLSQEDIREEVDTFMFEGHDTTTSGISFCLYLLSRHASIQQKVFNEILEVLGPDKDKSITMRDLHNLKYLEAVIKESLRLYPSVPIIGRQTVEDIQIGDQIIPANCTIGMLVYAAGRDPDYFNQPNEFNPERFYSESPDTINSFAYVPFSAGPRNCIGQKFAMLEMKSTISRVLRHFELLPSGEDVVQVLSLILRSVNGVQLALRPRKD
ncbi:putative cytochrome P450 4d14 [Lucilia cuprina]|nr:putative cytochrome P450 4d14 [Lucilia cuprina]